MELTKTISQKSDCDCGIVHNGRSNPLRRDPQRLGMLRRSFEKDMRKRLRHLKRAIKTIVVDRDVFHLNSDVAGNPFTANAPFFFDSYGLPSGSELDNIINGGDPDYIADTRVLYDQQDPSDQLTAYQDWFQEQVDAGLLWVSGDGKGWTNKYIESTYKKALIRSYNDVHGLGGKAAPFEQGSRAEFLSSAFGSGVGQKQLQLLGTRCFQQLKGVTAAMEQQMSRVLADGLAHGLGSKQIARNLNKVVTELGKKRALVLARTEMAHAYAEGQLDSFEQSNVRGVGVMAEWSTAGDDRVCDACAPLEGIVLEIREARMILPRHPNCRCAFLPAGVGEGGQTAPQQKDDKESIEDALDKSILAQKRKGETLEEAKARLSWSGVNKRIARDRYRTTGVRYRAGGEYVERDDEGELPPRPRRHEEKPMVTEHGNDFGTGTPVTFTYARNPESAPYLGDTFQQDIEPAGKYVIQIPPKTQPPEGWESGEITFRNPLVVKLTDDPDEIYGSSSWKANLSKKYGNKTGAELAQAIRNDGYDGIVTVSFSKEGVAQETREIVDLTMFVQRDTSEKIETELDKEAYRDPKTLRQLLDNLIENEGFSYDVKEDDDVQGGFMVSPYPELELIAFDNIKPEDMEDEDLQAKIAEAMEKFVEKNADIIRDDPQAHFGAWWDKDTQRIYLDVVVRVETAEEAHALSVIYKQESYFDLNNIKEIKVGAREEDEKSSEADDIPTAKKGDEQADETGVDAADVRRAAGTERRKAAEERRQAEEEKGMKGVGEVDEEEEELLEIEDELAEEKEAQRIKDLEDLEEEMRKDLGLPSAADFTYDDDEEELSSEEKEQANREREKRKYEAEQEAKAIEKEIERLELTMEGQTLHDADIDEIIAMRKSVKDKTKELEDLYGEIGSLKTDDEKQAELDKIVEQIKKRKEDEAKKKEIADRKKDFWQKREDEKKLPEDMTPREEPPANMSVGDIEPDEFVRRVWGVIGDEGVLSSEHAQRIGAMIHDQIILENPEMQELQDEYKRVMDRNKKSFKEANKLQKQSRDWLRENDTPEQTKLRSYNKSLLNHPDSSRRDYLESTGKKETFEERDIRVRKAIAREFKGVTLKVNPFEDAQAKLEEQIQQDNKWIMDNHGAYDREYGTHVMKMIPRIRETGIALGESNTYEDRPFFMDGDEYDRRSAETRKIREALEPDGTDDDPSLLQNYPVYEPYDTEFDSTIIRSAERISPYLPKDWVDLMGSSYVDVTTEHVPRGAFDSNRNVIGLESQITPISEGKPAPTISDPDGTVPRGWNKNRSNLGKAVDRLPIDKRYQGESGTMQEYLDREAVNDTTKLKISSSGDSKKVIQSYIDEHIEQEVEDLREEVFDEDSRGTSFIKDQVKRQLEARGRKLEVHVDDLPEHEKNEILRDFAEKNIKMDRVTAHELLHAIQHASGDKLTRLEREFLYSKWKKQEAKEVADDEAKRIKAGATIEEWGVYGISDREGLMNADDGWYKLTDDFTETYAGKMYLVDKYNDQLKPLIEVGRGGMKTTKKESSYTRKIMADAWLERTNPDQLQSEAYEVMTVGVEDIFFGGYQTSEHKDYRDFTLGILMGF